MALKNKSNIKGHSLCEQAMQVAIPAINIAIYVNPILTFLVKAALITATIEKDGIQIGNDRSLSFYQFSFTISKQEKTNEISDQSRILFIRLIFI